MNGNE
jgi:hypothetical protein